MNARFLLTLALVLGSLTCGNVARADQASPATTPQTQTAPAAPSPAPIQLAWQRVGAPISLES